MENNGNTNNNVPSPNHSSSFNTSPISPPHSPPNPINHNNHVIISPCAACKTLRRRCANKCVLAPYFPPTEPLKFTIAHRVFGASNIIKFLQELPEDQRADAVSSMVYEANARIRDPVYGCAGAIFQLQKQASELQAQLTKAQVELVNIQSQQANLIALICMEMKQSNDCHQEVESLQQLQQLQQQFINIDASCLQHFINVDTSCFLDESNLGTSWEPLWA